MYKQYPENSLFNKIKIGLGVAKLLCVNGYKDAKADFKVYRELRKKEKKSDSEVELFQRIKWDFIKAIPAFSLLFAPMGSPFFLVYLTIFPNFTPTWILTEKIYKRLRTLKR